MWHIATVAWSVSLSVTIMSPAKTDEPIEMPFGMWNLVDPMNYTLDGGPHPHTLRRNFENERGSSKDMPRHVQRLSLIHI